MSNNHLGFHKQPRGCGCHLPIQPAARAGLAPGGVLITPSQHELLKFVKPTDGGEPEQTVVSQA